MSNAYQQNDPQYITITPLKGIHRETQSTRVATGGMLDVANLIVDTTGLRRRPVLVDVAGNAAVDHPPVQAVIPYFKSDGTQETIVADQKFIYRLTVGTGFTGVYSTYTAGTVTVSGVAVTGSGTTWDATNDVRGGDVIVLDANGLGDGPEAITIAAVGGTTAITLAHAPTGTYGAETDYAIRRAFGAADPFALDWVTGVDSKIVFCDSVRTLRAYNGTTFAEYDTDIDIIPTCIAHFLDRVWAGRYIEGAADWRQGITWSQVVDKTVVPGDFLNLPYTPGYVKRLIPNGNLLMAYFSDSLWVGTATSGIAGDVLPASFQRVDYSGVGLLGPRGVVAALGGHFAVLSDNIYFVSGGQVQAIGTPVVKQTVKACYRPYRISAAHDVDNQCIVFAFPEDSATPAKIWRFHYLSKEWSYDEFPCDMVGDGVVSFTETTYATWTATAPHTTGTITDGTGTTLTGSGTGWLAAGILAGATILIDTDGTGRYVTVYTVASNAAAETSLTTVETITDFAGESYSYRIVQAADDYSSLTDPTYGSIGTQLVDTKYLFVGKGGRLLVPSNSQTTDYDGEVPAVRLETPDFDGGSPDNDKFFSRLSLKIDQGPAANLAFTVWFSTDRGVTWESAPNILIAAGRNEDYTNFRATGSHIRFRLQSSSAVAQYTIEELCFKVFGRDVEYRPGD